MGSVVEDYGRGNLCLCFASGWELLDLSFWWKMDNNDMAF